jgi:hypothetical protein
MSGQAQREPGTGDLVKKLLTVAAATLLLAVTGCSKAPAPTPATSSQPLSSSSSPTSSLTSSAPTPDGSATGTGTPVAVDQSSPEAAMTSWLMAMFAGDTAAVCSLMASQGKAIAEVPQAVETCSSMIGTMLEQLAPLADAFRGLTIDGATITGDTATFESATTQPAMAAQIIRSFKAVRIDGDWYITEG